MDTDQHDIESDTQVAEDTHQPSPVLAIARTIQEYFDNPSLFAPHPDFVKDNYFVEVE